MSSFRHHRQNYVWLLNNKQLCFVLNMLQLILWFVPTFWSIVTYLWQMSGSECYAHFCSPAALFWAVYYSRGQNGDPCHSWSCRFSASRWTIITTKTTERQRWGECRPSPLSSSCQKVSFYSQSFVFSGLESVVIVFIAFQLGWWSFSCQEAQSTSRRTKPPAD